MDLPVILICYNRPKHTARVLDSLKKHKIETLYVFSDAPKSGDDVSKVNETRALIQAIDWTKPQVVEQTDNKGLAESIVAAVTFVLARHERMVLLEDDCVPHKYFFEFMRKGLDRYEEDERVFGLCGHSPNLPSRLLKNYPYDAFFHPRIGTWGWATWRRAWQHYEPDLQTAYDEAVEKSVDLAQGGFGIVENVIRQLNGVPHDIWSLNWALSVYNRNGCYLYPTSNQIENIGFDGSGVNCGNRSSPRAKGKSSNIFHFPEKVFEDKKLIQYCNFFMDGGTVSRLAGLSSWFADRRQRTRPSQKGALSIVHVNTHDFAGGAAKVAWRLCEAQRSQGYASSMFVKHRLSNEEFVHAYSFEDPQDVREPCVKRGLLDYHFRGIQKFLQTPAVKNADVVHLHNLHGNYFNPFFLMDLSKIKPIVWTLHDMQAFTGHCAYSMGCDKWQYGCGDCPHLDTYPAVETDSTAKMLRDKGYIYGQTNMSVVAPSHWLYEMLQKSTLRKQKSYLLYNGVDTNIFHPLDREAVRSQLSIPPDALALGIVAHGGVTNCFKGGQSVLSVFREFANQRKCVLLNVGDDSPSTQPGIINVPRVVDEARLCELYNAMDIFLLPSEADNCPLVVLEALACGTPVAAFATGGIPELVRDNIDGVIVKNGDLNRLFKRIASLVDDKGAVAMSRSNARNRALSFAHEKMVDKYEAIYLETMRHWQAKYGDG